MEHKSSLKTNQRMKIFTQNLLLAGLLTASQNCLHAQTNQTTQTFFATAGNYLTTFNTNGLFNWTNCTLEVATGYKQVTGVNAASTLDAQYDFGRWNVGAACQFSGVGSPINAVAGQGGYDLIEHYDAKLEADLRAGYDNVKSAAVFEPALFIAKKPTPNTFFKSGISLPIFTCGKLNTSPTFYLETGFTY
jgi:hypothetical protein